MRKYLPGLTSLVCALIFSAFTKPFVFYTFKLLAPPTCANIADQAQWSTAGSFYGFCITPPNNIACKISLNAVQTTYYHASGSDQILNTYTYADTQSPKQDYLDITPISTIPPDCIIFSIQPKHYNTSTSSYENANLGTDLNFANGKK